MIPPAIPQTVMSAWLPQSGVAASAAGSNPAVNDSTKGFSGKTEATRSIQLGSSPMAKMPEMKDSRIKLALPKALAAFGVGATDATARPRAAQLAVPTRKVRTSAGTFAEMIDTS